MSSKRGWHTRQRNRVKRSNGNDAALTSGRQRTNDPNSLLVVLTETAGAKAAAGRITPLFSETLYRAREFDPL